MAWECHSDALRHAQRDSFRRKFLSGCLQGYIQKAYQIHVKTTVQIDHFLAGRLAESGHLFRGDRGAHKDDIGVPWGCNCDAI